MISFFRFTFVTLFLFLVIDMRHFDFLGEAQKNTQQNLENTKTRIRAKKSRAAKQKKIGKHVH